MFIQYGNLGYGKCSFGCDMSLWKVDHQLARWLLEENWQSTTTLLPLPSLTLKVRETFVNRGKLLGYTSTVKNPRKISKFESKRKTFDMLLHTNSGKVLFSTWQMIHKRITISQWRFENESLVSKELSMLMCSLRHACVTVDLYLHQH